jgi:hypothetical protein
VVTDTLTTTPNRFYAKPKLFELVSEQGKYLLLCLWGRGW